jgi:hypothetical protein
MNSHQVSKWQLVGGWIDVITGLCGAGVAVVFMLSQINMGALDTLGTKGISAGNLGLVFLMVHLVIFALAIITGGWLLLGRAGSRRWSLALALLALALLAVSLIPGSTIGFFMLPMSAGVLLGSLLLATAPASQVRP